jgi:hypothetical protein
MKSYNNDEVRELALEVSREWSCEVKNEKRLFQRRLEQNFFKNPLEYWGWHYGIKLSDKKVLGWHKSGMVIETTDEYDYRSTSIKTLPQEEIYRRVLQSCFVHQDFRYCKVGWNCEHWARGIATKTFNSFQTVFTAGIKNVEAEKRMKAYIPEVKDLWKLHYPGKEFPE